MYTYVQVHSNATSGGTVLVRNSTFGIASHHGTAMIHVAGTESVVIEDSVFHGEGSGDANTGVNGSGGSRRFNGSGIHADFANTRRKGPSNGFGTHAEFATDSGYGSGIKLDTHLGLTTGRMDGRAHGSDLANSRAIFTGPEVDLSVTGSTFVLGSTSTTGPGGGWALSCYGAVIRGCTFVVAVGCSEVRGMRAQYVYVCMLINSL